MKKLLSIFLIALFSFINDNAYCQATIVPGEVPHSYDVSPNGSFNYSVPLRIPPGIKDMIPNLAINYNSQSGNGILGFGWSISGLSAITRGLPTLYHNGDIQPVDLNSDDVYFLDGQRLLGGPTYQTEVKNFAIIESHGTAGNGPSYFTVEYPNGTIYEYGNSTSSKMLAQASSTALMWAVNRITDAHGNYIDFEYVNSQSTGEYRINKITYGLNNNPSTSSKTIPAYIKFNYQSGTRQDANETYVNGSEILSNKLLDNIEVQFSDLSQANKYQFTYDTDMLSRLIKIEELRDGQEILSPITINWGASPNWATPDLNYATLGYSKNAVLSGDYNGDGFTDIVTTNLVGNTTDVSIYMNNGGTPSFTTTKNIPLEVTPNGNIVSNSATQSRRAVDYNGDGMDDLIFIEHLGGTGNGGSTKAYKVWLMMANGTSTIFDNPILLHTGQNSHSKNDNFLEFILVTNGDYDGDGKSDVIVFAPYSFKNTSEVIEYEVFIIGEEYNGAHKIEHPNLAHISSLYTLDYNGDGKDEFMFTHIDNSVNVAEMWGLWISNYTSGFHPVLNQTPTQWPIFGYGYNIFPSKNQRCWFGDFNGDGKSDIMSWDSPNGWSIAYSDGVTPAFSNHTRTVVSNTSHTLSALSLYGPGQTQNGGVYGWYPADFNADGYCDFLQLIRTGVNTIEYKLFYSTGDNFYQTYGTLSINDVHTLMMALGNFSGNGQTELFHSRYTPAQLVKFRGDDNSLKVTSIDHIGKTLDVEYTTLPQDPDYVKLATGNGYFKNRTLPIKVVKNLSDNVSLNNTYTYEGAMYHSCGLGFRGFKNFSVENNISQKTFQEYDLTSNQYPFITRTQVFEPYSGMPYGKETVYQYIDVDGGMGGKSRIIMSNPSVTTDYINGVVTENNIITGATNSGTVFYDYGKVASTETYQKDMNAAGIYDMKIYSYDYGTNWGTNKGKPEEVTVYSQKDPNGLNGLLSTTQFTYNTYGDIATKTFEPGSSNEKIETITYDSEYGNIIRSEISATGIANPLVTEYTYTDDGRFMVSESKLVDPNLGLHYVKAFNYGGPTQLIATWGNVLSETNIKGINTDYEYDVLNRVVKTTDNAYGYVTDTEYDWAFNSQHSTANPDQQFVVTATNQYNSEKNVLITDKYGRIIRSVDSGPGGDVVEDLTYTDDGKVSTSTAPYLPFSTKLTTTFQYDSYSRETHKQTDNGGKQIFTSYTFSGGLLQTTVTNQGAGNRSRTYETCGEYLKRIFNSSLTEEITYTYHGNGEKAITFSNGMRFENKVDNFGRLTEVIQPNAGSKLYTYNALDRVEIETLTNGTQYQFTYDNLGRVLTKEEVGAGLNPYTYEYGNTMNMADAGELKSKEAPNGNKTEYIYDAAGNVIASMEYNGLQNFIPSNQPFSTIYSYNQDGSINSITYLNDLTIYYYYNSWGGLSTVKLNSTLLPGTGGNNPRLLWQSWGYNAFGQLDGAYFYDVAGNQLYNVGHGWDAFGQPKSETISNNNFLSGPIIKDMSYSFDVHTGNLLDRRDNLTNNLETFDYDSYYDRLTKITFTPGNGSPQQIVDMDYDGNNTIGGSLGNISDKTDVAAPVVHNPSQKGWKYQGYALDVIPDPAAVSSIPQFKQEVSYYNFQKVQRIEEEMNDRVDFEYGADDHRVKAEYYDITGGSANPVLQHTKYYASNYEYIIDPANGDKHNIYIWAGNTPIAIIQGQSASGTYTPSTANLYYVATDYLGSITHIMDDNGSGGALGVGLVEERSFDAWGRVREPQTWMTYPTGPGGFPGNWITDRGYTGQEHIWLGMYDNNVINLNGRIYDPLVGRMFSPDPFIPNATNSQDYNKYIYARNNPLKYTDKNGEWVWVAVGAAVGGLVNLGIQAYKGNVNSFGDGLKAFGVGAVAGAVITATGGAVTAGLTGSSLVAGVSGSLAAGTGGFAAGTISGAVSGAVGNAILATGNALLLGDVDPNRSLGEQVLESTMWGAAGGAVIGGVVNGAVAVFKGNNFWTGTPKPVTRLQTTTIKPIPTTREAKAPVGTRESPLRQFDGQKSNKAITISGYKFTGHALDRMQEYGISSPSAVIDVAKNPISTIPQQDVGIFLHIGHEMQIIVHKAGRIITVTPK